MTVHLVPAGVSVLTAVRELKAGVRPDGLDPRTTQTHQLLDGLLTEFEPRREASAGWLLDTPEGRQLLDRFAQQVQLSRWGPRISAEVQSLHEGGYHPDRDLVLLPATDTVEGLLAASLAAVRLAPDRAAFLAGPDQVTRDALATPGSVHVVRIPGMDLSHADDFTAAMRQLGRFGRALHLALRANTEDGTTPEPDLRFHLSGGYKAAIPFFLALAEGMRSLRQGSTSVTACCLHEKTTGAQKLIPVPLRFFSALDPLRQELQALTTGRHLPRHDRALLQGYAYEAKADGYELTPFGAGLLELLTPDGDPPTDVMQP